MNTYFIIQDNYGGDYWYDTGLDKYKTFEEAKSEVEICFYESTNDNMRIRILKVEEVKVFTLQDYYNGEFR